MNFSLAFGDLFLSGCLHNEKTGFQSFNNTVEPLLKAKTKKVFLNVDALPDASKKERIPCTISKFGLSWDLNFMSLLKHHPKFKSSNLVQ